MPHIYQIARYPSLRRPSALALPDRNRRLDFAALYRMIRRVVGLVTGVGVGPDGRVLAVLYNSIENVVFYHANALGCLILAPVNFRFGPDQLRRQAEDRDPALKR
jgi:acyl-coenzyme A synthetase/AMP-(fatty) acid ligase